MARLIIVVDDEPDIVELISHHLRREGFQVRGFYDGESLLDYLKQETPDLIILDLMLPGVNGLEVCSYLRREPQTAQVPLIILTARGTEVDRVVGLELGADDYVVKPFSPRELVARVKAVLRRAQLRAVGTTVVKMGNLTIDSLQFRVQVRGQEVVLTPTEFRILQMLAERPGAVFSREQILERLWGYDKVVSDRTVDVHIASIRDKLGELGHVIKTIRGVGYKLEE